MAAGRIVKVFTARKRKTVPRVKFSRPVRSTKSLVKLIKKVSLGTTETKHFIQTTENINIYHNVAYGVAYNLLSPSSQGSTQITHIGDEIFAKSLHIKLWISQKLDRPNVMYRMILMSAVSTQAIAWLSGGNGNLMMAIPDTDKITIRKQKLIQPKSGDYSLESGATNKERSQLLSFSLKLNRKIKYATDGGTTPKLDSNYYSLYLIPYDAFGTPTSDNIASFAFQSILYYKDP